MNLTELCQLPDTTEGNAARRLLWSLWNQHRSVNLWNEVSSLSGAARGELGRLIAMSIEAREAALRAIFADAGEFDRIDTHPIA